MTAGLICSLQKLDDVEVYIDEPIGKHTSLGVGGPADLFVQPHSIDALCEVVRLTSASHARFFVLGEGTNVIIRDGGIRGVVIGICDNLAQFSRDGNYVVAQAGLRVAMLCRQCCDWALSGLEFAAGIPGSIGGALVMNAGAYDGDMNDVVQWVLAIDKSGQRYKLLRDELQMAYRQSVFQHNDMIIAEAGFMLKPDDGKAIRQRMYEYLQRRCEKQPVAQKSAGSVFKRPKADYAGRLLEEAGVKGMQVRGAMISQKHANFIVHSGNGRAQDVLKLIDLVRNRVHDHFGVWLEPEVMIVGEKPSK